MRGLARLDRAQTFVLAIGITFLLPAAIPRMGVDYPYLMILLLVLGAWFIMKWGSVRDLTSRGSSLEHLLGVSLIGVVYAYNIALNSRLGILDMLVIFSALAVAMFGIRSFRLFWVPATYGIVLLLGYQLENDIPNYVAMQDWMASVVTSFVQVLGITARVAGHIITLNTGPSTLQLDIESDCTGIQGVLAFGMLSTMVLLDMKPRLSRLIPIFVVGFIGVFLINIVRLLAVVLTFDFLGTSAGTEMHLFVGYFLFIAWVLVFWMISLKYLAPGPLPGSAKPTLQPSTLNGSHP